MIKIKYIEEISLIGPNFIHGFGSEDFYIKEIDRDIANKIIKENHYSHKFYNETYIHLGLNINS